MAEIQIKHQFKLMTAMEMISVQKEEPLLKIK